MRTSGLTAALLSCVLLHTTGVAHWLHVRVEHASPPPCSQLRQAVDVAAEIDADLAAGRAECGAAAWHASGRSGHRRAACLECVLLDPSRMCGLASNGPWLGEGLASGPTPAPACVTSLIVRKQLRPTARPPPVGQRVMPLASPRA